MNYLDKESLFNTVDNVSEALLFNFEMNADEKKEIAEFIVNQHGKPRTYANTFAPTELDLTRDLILFTGERIKTNAGKCHMIGEEASRILRKLELQNDKISIALHQADTGLHKRIAESSKNPKYDQGIHYGTYCCKTCSCALWINLASGGLNNDIELLKGGLTYLKRHRDDKGKWIGFPYYYTLYVLNEIDTALVKDEMNYAAKTIEKKLKIKKLENKYELRRTYIYEQILDKVNTSQH